MAFTYRQVKDLHDALKDKGATTATLPEWSEELNRLTNSDLYSAGMEDNWIKRASVGLDRLIESTGLPDMLGEVGAGVGTLVGNEDAGRRIGQKVLRGIVDFAPLLTGVGAVARLGGTALLSGVNAYTETGSPAAGVVAGATSAAMPGVANFAEQAALKGLGAPLLAGRITTRAGVEGISQYLPQSLSQGALSQLAGQGAAAVLGEAGNAVQAGLDPNQDYEFSPSEAFLGATVGQIPFGVTYLGSRGREPWGGVATRNKEAALKKNMQDTQSRLEIQEAQDAVLRKNPIEQVPFIEPQATVNPVVVQDTQRRLDEIMGKAVLNRQEPATELSVEDYNRMAKEYNDVYNEAEGFLSQRPLELPVAETQVPQDAPIFQPEEYLQKASDDVDSADTRLQFHEAIGRLNTVRSRYGMDPLAPADIQKRAETLGISEKAAARGAINNTKRKLDAVEAAKLRDRDNISNAVFRDSGGDTPVRAENLGTVDGKPLMRLPKLDPASFPLHELVDEIITGEIATKGELAFVKWRQSANAGDKTSLPIERERYKIYHQLREDNDISRDAVLSPEHAEVLNDNFNDQGIGFDNSVKATTFPARQHISVWDNAVTDSIQRKLMENQKGSASPVAATPEENALVRQRSAYRPASEQEANLAQQIGQTGESALLHLLDASTNAQDLELARAFAQFPDLLKRTTVGIRATGEPSQAYMNSAMRKGHIWLDQGLLYADPETRNFTILHELAHQLSLAELNNPTKAGTVEQLNALREKVIQALPKDLKESFDKALATDFIKRYGDNQADITELHPDFDKANVLYGLLNTQEFVSQGFTSPQMRDFLRSTKGQKLGWWGKFKEFVGSLVGMNPRGTAFDEFLTGANALVEQGNYVASFHNFAERFFEGQGATTGRASTQTQRALGLVLEANRYAVRPEDLFQSLNATETNRSPSFVRARNALERSIAARDEDYASLVSLAPEMGVEPTRDGIDDFALQALSGDVTAQEMLQVLPDNVSRYVFEKINDMREVLSSLEAASAEKNQGLVNLANPQSLRAPVKSAIKKIDKLLDSERMLDEAVAALSGVAGVTPQGFADKWTNLPTDSVTAAAPKKIDPFANTETEQSRRGWTGWVSRFLKPIAQYQEQPFREAAAKGFQLEPNARKMETEATKVFAKDLATDEFSHDSVKRLGKDLENDKVIKAVDKIIFENQKAAKDGGTGVVNLPESDPRIAQHLRGLDAKERQNVSDFVAKHGLANRIMNRQIIEKVEQISVVEGAQALNRMTDLKMKDSMALSEGLWNAVNADFQDPVAAAKAQNDIAMIQQKLTPEAFNGLLSLLQNNKEVRKTYMDFFAENPNWSSAQRYGKYRVKFFDKQGKVQLHGVDSKKEALALAKGQKIEDFYPAVKPGDEEVPQFGSDYQQVFDRLSQLQDNKIEMMRSMGATAEEIAFEQKTSPVTQFARESTALQGLKNLDTPTRGLTRGAENLPWLSNQFSYMKSTSRYWSRKLFRAQMDASIAQKELTENMKSDLRTHRDNILQADPDSIKNLNAFARTWFMGFNPANVIVNAAQPFTTHVAELTSLTGKPLDSYRRVLSALKEIGGGRAKAGQKSEWADPEINKLMQRALDDGEVGLSQYDDDAAVQEASAVNFKRHADANRPKSLGQYLSSAFGAFQRAGMKFFQAGEGINNRAALIARFRLAREQGRTFDEAYSDAVDFNHRVNFGGGKASRPVGAFSGRSPVLRGTAMLATAMQSYVLGTTFQVARYLKSGFFNPKGLTPHEKFSARKAAVQMLATQLAAAGVLGLPFVSGALSLLDKMFPELEANKNVRKWVQEFFSEDDENGNVMTDIAMTGMPSMMGWDLQSRLSMGNTLPGVSEVNGFQPENLLGPPANLIANFVSGGGKLLRGEGTNAFTPPAIKKFVELASSGGTLKDYRDRPIFTPTPGEAVGVALGFNPKRLSDFNAASRMGQLAETNQRNERFQFNQQMAETVLEGNFGTVKSELRAKAQSDPNFDPVDAIHQIARVAEELTFPRDLRREGSTTAKSRLLSAWNIPANQPSEAQRLAFRQQIEAQFGLRSAGTEEIQRAMMMDQLRAQQPELSRTELRRMVDASLRRQRQRVSLE